MIDSYRHKGLRANLIQILIKKGIKDKRVLDAIAVLPRHYFLEKAFDGWAYKDIAFPIDADQTISQPYTVARQTELLEIEKGDKILEIGTGSGYQATILSMMGAKVYTIERQEKLFHKTNVLLQQIGHGQIRTLLGDGHKGAPRFAPFDKIIVTAGATEIPQALLSQLAIDGLMVIPVGSDDVKRMLRIRRESFENYKREVHGSYRFVPFVKGVKEIPN